MSISYRRAEDAVAENALECICCELQLDSHEGFCPECQTPAEISSVVQRRETTPNFVSVLGPSNAGKTVYLGVLLDLLGSSTGPIRGAANGTFSISLQEHVVNALEQRCFPEKTPVESDSWRWLHCDVTLKNGKKPKQYDFVAPDVAGEAISFELEQASTYRAIQYVVQRSGGILILCDSAEVRDAGSQEDLYALKLASYIEQNRPVSNNRRGKSDNQPAVAVVFTKADICPEASEDPIAFAKNNMPRFFDFCERHFPVHKHFASSVVGASCMINDPEAGDRQIPLHIQPRGVVEPLHWIMSQF